MRIIISNSSQEPIYKQITSQIKKMIMTGELNPGDSLPSIRNLARELHISVITTKRAFEDLEREGLVETVAGKGSFVSQYNREIIKEKKMEMIEEKLANIVQESKSLGISPQVLQEMIKLLYEEG